MAKTKPWPPRWLTKVPAADRRRGDAERFLALGEATCRIVKDSAAAPAGSLISYRSHQRELFSHLLARRSDFRYRHRVALIGKPRKNAKSGETSTIGVAGVVLDPPGSEIYSCAADREQAKVVFGTAKRMIDLDPVLSSMLKTYRDVIENPTTGTIYKALSAEAFTKEGLNPSRVLFDELHAQPNRELWDVMSLATGARPDPMLIAITTAGQRMDRMGKQTICYELYQYGVRVAAGEVHDPSFFFAWWEPRDPAADWRDPKVWAEANPGFGDLVRIDDFESAARTTPEPEFRTKRLNQWVNTYSSWLPSGVLEKRRVKDPIPEGDRVVLVFDGSYNGDSTAILAVSVTEKPRVQGVALWERTPNDPPDWTVPVQVVEDEIRAACRRWDVVEIACDTARWARSFQILANEGLPVVEFPQSPQRMTPATAQTFEAIMNGQLEYVADGLGAALERHVQNAQLRVTSRGSQLSKESSHSGRKIDLAVCMVMGVARAAWWAGQPDDGIWAY